MNIMVQPPDYYLLVATQQAAPRRHRPVRPARATGPSLRTRLQTMVARTTLGPMRGDHVLGDSQWSPRAATR